MIQMKVSQRVNNKEIVVIFTYNILVSKIKYSIIFTRNFLKQTQF